MTNDQSFITDEWLIPESRIVKDDEGQDHLVTLERRYWAAFSFLSVESHATGPELVGAAFRDAPRQKMSFEESLKNLIAWMDGEYRNQPGIWNRNLEQSTIAGRIGPVSTKKIRELECQKQQSSEDMGD